MNFFEAMKELEKGNKVRNADWKDTIYLYKENQKICFSDTCPVLNLNTSDLNYGTWELYQESILDKTEKEYLSNVIKPFKNNVAYIMKDELSLCSPKYVFIKICVKAENKTYEYIKLPTFISDSRYKNMELGYTYSLKELGLNE